MNFEEKEFLAKIKIEPEEDDSENENKNSLELYNFKEENDVNLTDDDPASFVDEIKIEIENEPEERNLFSLEDHPYGEKENEENELLFFEIKIEEFYELEEEPTSNNGQEKDVHVSNRALSLSQAQP